MFFAVLKRKNIIISLLVIASVVLSAVFLGGGAKQTFNKNRLLPIYSVKREDKKIAISFDCAWGVDYTDKLLEIMQSEGVRCTFFMVEFWTTKHPEYVKKISDFGHEIGTHSSTHPYMSKLDEGAIRKELSTSSLAIENITGKKVEVFRPPYGDYDNLLIQTAEDMGLYTIQWDVDSLDWKDLDKNQIEKRVLSRVKSGSIVLFHNQGLHTAEALPQIIKELKAKGYSFVPIGELIYRENFYIASNGEQIKNS